MHVCMHVRACMHVCMSVVLDGVQDCKKCLAYCSLIVLIMACIVLNYIGYVMAGSVVISAKGRSCR